MNLFNSKKFTLDEHMDKIFEESDKAIASAMDHLDNMVEHMGDMNKIIRSTKITKSNGVEEIKFNGKRYREIKPKKKKTSDPNTI